MVVDNVAVSGHSISAVRLHVETHFKIASFSSSMFVTCDARDDVYNDKRGTGQLYFKSKSSVYTVDLSARPGEEKMRGYKVKRAIKFYCVTLYLVLTVEVVFRPSNCINRKFRIVRFMSTVNFNR